MDSSATHQSCDRKERYKVLLNEIADINDNIGTRLTSETCRAVAKIIQTCDDIHREGQINDKLENTSEVVLDAQIIKCTHESISKLLQSNSQFGESMFLNALNAWISHNESENWLEMAKITVSVSKSIPIKSSMLGSIDVEPEERVAKERQHRKRNVLTQEKQPDTIKQLKRDDRGAEKVKIILKQISDIFRSNGRKPIPYFQLIIDPNDFMNTVENAFQMAFLARDGNIAIETGRDGNPQVRLASKDEMEMHQDTSQSICVLNMELCERMKSFYSIRRAMLHVPADTDEQNNPNDESDSD